MQLRTQVLLYCFLMLGFFITRYEMFPYHTLLGDRGVSINAAYILKKNIDQQNYHNREEQCPIRANNGPMTRIKAQSNSLRTIICEYFLPCLTFFVFFETWYRVIDSSSYIINACSILDRVYMKITGSTFRNIIDLMWFCNG